MRAIFRLLSRRWLGVTGWGYAFSLALAVLTYWMLPATSLIHRWALSGAYNIDGFSQVDRMTIIVSQLANREERFRLDTITGAISRCMANDEGSKQLNSPVELPYQLSYSSSLHHHPKTTLVLKKGSDGTEHSILCHESEGTHIEVDYVYFSHGNVAYATKQLTTSGMVVMSGDERKLILLGCQVRSWSWLKNWLMERTGWSLSFLPNDLVHTAFIYGLLADQVTTCDLSTRYSPEFVIHPDSIGFCVVELERDIMGDPELGGKETIISWYGLPPGPAYHTRNQWFLIFGTLLIPIISAMLLRLFRRLRPVSLSSASK